MLTLEKRKRPYMNQFGSHGLFSFMEKRLLGETDFSSNFTNTYQQVFSKKIRNPLRARTVLMNYVNTEFEGDLQQQGDTVRVFTVPAVTGSKSKKSATNFYDKIARTSGTPTYESLRVDECYRFNVVMSKVDQKLSDIPALADKYVAEVQKDLDEVMEADISSNLVYTDNNNIIVHDNGKLQVDGAVTLGATTIKFDVVTNIAAGDIVFFTDTDGNTGAFLVKSLVTMTRVVTIETNPTLFPIGIDGRDHFAKLVVALPAIADNAIAYADIPTQVTKTSFYDILIDLQTRIQERKAGGETFTFAQVRPVRLLSKDDSTLLKSLDLSREVIINGTGYNVEPSPGSTVRRIDGGDVISSPNAAARQMADGTIRYYILQARKQWALHYVEWLQGSAVETIQETAGMVMSHSGANIYQSHAFRQGRKGLALAVVYI